MAEELLPRVQVIQTEQGKVRVPEQLSSVRQAVPLDSEFATPADNKAMSEGVQFSQHRRIIPGNYTGYMRGLVQLLLGVGMARQNTYERRLVTLGEIPPILGLGEEADSEDFDNSWGVFGDEDTGIAQVMYDYRADRTHGLTWNVVGQCFVVEIGIRGAFAWPLKVDQDSLLPEFKQQYEELYPELFRPDTTGLGLFDLLGGFPTPDPPPDSSDLEKMVRAGEILQLRSQAEMQAFYSKFPMYSNCGWAFAPYQRVAVNTCWGIQGDGPHKDIKIGYLYYLYWSIGAWEEPSSNSSAAYIIDRLSSPEEWEVNKARRLSSHDASSLVAVYGGRTDEEFQAAFDALVVSPLANAFGVLVCNQSGWLYHPSMFQGKGDFCSYPTGHPQFKMPEEQSGHQVSFNFEPEGSGGKAPPRCDTPIWACWVGEQLMVVNYFWEPPNTLPIPEVATIEECQVIGSWTTSTPAVANTLGSFHSNFFDLRRNVRTVGKTTTKTTGRPAGTSDYYSFLQFFGNCCAIIRNVYTTNEVSVDIDGGGNWRDSLAIPFGDRSILYSATLAEVSGMKQTYSISPPILQGNTGFTRWGYVYEFLCHWSGGCPSGKKGESSPCVLTELQPYDQVESCFSSYGMPEFPDYQPCDGDPGCSGRPGNNNCGPLSCAYSATFNSSVGGSSGYSSETPVVNRFDWEVRIWGDTHIHGRYVMRGALAEEGAERFDTPMTEWWWRSSPVCEPPMFCRFDVGVNRWGRALINFQDQVDPSITEHSGAPDSLYTGPQAVFFGYVSDEVRDYG